MSQATICEKTIAYGDQRYKVDSSNNWQVQMYGSHGPNDPLCGLSWKWYYISSDKVPDEVKKVAQ